MIRVLIPCDLEFKKYSDKCRKLYENLQEQICDTSSYDFIVNNTFFYLFLNDDKLLGAIYYFTDDSGRLLVNAFAGRKTHKLNIECMKMSLKWFKGSIYAEAQNRASALCLLKCGFEREKDNLFVYRRG